jgi:hypothetical protein
MPKADDRNVKLEVSELELLEVFVPDTDALPAVAEIDNGTRKFVGT